VTPRARAAVAIAGLAGGGAITIALVATGGSTHTLSAPRTSPFERLLIVTSRDRSITWADVTDLRGPAQDAIATVAGWEQTPDTITTDDGTNWRTRVIGTEPAYAETRGWTVAQGAFFDATPGAKQVVLGATAARMLFPQGAPVGATVRVGTMPFVVVGVLAEKGTSSTGEDRDDLAIVPASVYERLHGGPAELHLDVAATDADHLDDAEHQVDHLLRVRHHLAPGETPDFQVRNIGKMLALRPELRSELP
jgi:hypothetical protein